MRSPVPSGLIVAIPPRPPQPSQEDTTASRPFSPGNAPRASAVGITASAITHTALGNHALRSRQGAGTAAVANICRSVDTRRRATSAETTRQPAGCYATRRPTRAACSSRCTDRSDAIMTRGNGRRRCSSHSGPLQCRVSSASPPLPTTDTSGSASRARPRLFDPHREYSLSRKAAPAPRPARTVAIAYIGLRQVPRPDYSDHAEAAVTPTHRIPWR